MSIYKLRPMNLDKAAFIQTSANTNFKSSNFCFHPNYDLQHLPNHAMFPQKSHRDYKKPQTANVKILHAASNLSSIEIHFDDKIKFNQLSYKQCNSYQALNPGTHLMKVSQTGNRHEILLNKRLYFEPGKFYTIILTEVSNSLRILKMEDSPCVPAGEAKIRFLHLLANEHGLDIAVKHRDILFPSLPYLHATDYLGITPMNIELEAKKTGRDETAVPLPILQLEANNAYTVIIVNQDVILINDRQL